MVAYRSDPVRYAVEKLKMKLWKKQQMILEALHTPPYRVIVESCNGAGKTAVLGVAVSHHYDCWDPGITIITSPRAEQVDLVTFKEIRRHLKGRPGLAPSASFLRHHPEHFIQGSTATDATSFQGHHGASLFFVFEEATGVEPSYWESVRGMAAGGRARWLAILNPTDIDSQAYQERSAVFPDGSKQWTVIKISAFEHPNIARNLAALPAVYEATEPGEGRMIRAVEQFNESVEHNDIPGAVDLAGVYKNITSDDTWGVWVEKENFNPETDVDLWDGAEYELGPGPLPPEMLAGAKLAFPERYWHPGPLGESRLLGRYPSQGLYSVFDDAMFQKSRDVVIEPPDPDLPEIGCDVARYGDDITVAVVQRSGKFLKMVKRAKQGTDLTAELLRNLCDEHAAPLGLDPRRIPVRVDDSGIGGGVIDQSRGYNFIPVIAQSSNPMQSHLYPDCRSEIMFHLKDRLVAGEIDLSRMGVTEVADLVRQATKIMWKPDKESRRKVLSKQQVKDKMGGKSPDELDAFGLAFYRLGTGQGPKASVPKQIARTIHRRVFGAGTRRLFGGG